MTDESRTEDQSTDESRTEDRSTDESLTGDRSTDESLTGDRSTDESPIDPATDPADAVVYCPLVTPFDDDGDVDDASLANLVEHLVDAGIDGLVPCGTTGEFAALTDPERRRVIETTVEAADGRVPVIAGVGGTAVASVRDRIAAAADAGADAVIVVAPYFGGQPSSAGNEAFYRAALADLPLPAYLYDIPSAAGQTLAPETVASLAGDGTVVGIKDSTGDPTGFGEVLRRTSQDFAVLQGWDAQYAAGLLLGAGGGINALSHLFPATFDAIGAALARGDLGAVRRHQVDTIAPAFQACVEHGFAPAVKAALAESGTLDSAAVRPPLEPLTGEARETFLATVEDAATDPG